MTKAVVLLVAASITMCGCGAVRGPQQTLGVYGPALTTPNEGPVGAFVATHSASYGARTDGTKAQEYLSSGLGLVNANCKRFFESAGETQQWLGVTRDTIVTVGSFGSAYLALQSGSRVAAGNLALFTGLANSGLDIYTKNFLFAAENISSVQSLVDRALIEHRRAVEQLAPFNYDSATGHILDNQNYCTPAAIAALARSAIKNGTVSAAVVGGGADTALIARADAAVLLRVGKTLGLPGPITSDQAGALWWLLNEYSSSEDRQVGILPKLQSLPTSAQPTDPAGAMRAGWPEAEVRRELGLLSSVSVADFRKQIDAAKQAVAAAAAARGQGAAAPPNLRTFSLNETQVRATSAARVTVDVR